MAAFHAGDVGAKKAAAPFDVALREVLCVAKGAQAVGEEHDCILHRLNE
jgi:hypothetical protein